MKLSQLCYSEEFFADHSMALSLLTLYEILPGTIFYAKDLRSCYAAANEAMLRAKNVKQPEELLGLSDKDFHPEMLAEAYIAEDLKVMQTGKPVLNEVWFVIDTGGRPGWYSSSKVPLYSGTEVIGLAGVRYPVKTPEDLQQPFERLSPALQYLEANCFDAVTTAQLANECGLSVTHFNRLFRQLFRNSPVRMLHQLRVEKACQLLADTDELVSEISSQIGYYDQSHFTRHFKRILGVSPQRYRRSLKQSSKGDV